METTELAIKNFDKQETIFSSKTRYKIVVKGRRFGLTRGASNDFIRQGVQYRFKKGLWVDTVNQNIDRYVERYFLPHLSKLPRNLWNWRKQAKVLEFLGSYIDFRSADRPENIEGFGYDKVFLNEAGIILKDEYLWHNAIRPMLWEYKPETVIGGTPKGKGLFFELNQRGRDPNQPEYESFHFTSFDNPYLDLASLKKDMASMPENVVKQEIYAEFLEDTGAVFRNFLQVMVATPQPPKKNHVYVMGVDLAKVQDFTVITVYDRDNNEQVYQDRFNILEWPYQKQKILGICRHYNNALMYVDGTGIGDPIVDDFLRAGVPVEPISLTNETKKEIIEKLSVWIETSRIKMLRLPDTIEEFSNFTYDVTSSGRIRYNAPAGFHDDIVIAHGLAIWGLAHLAPKAEPAQEIPIIRREYLKQKRRYENEEMSDDYDF